jgi:DNA invertase Pin-like site-specific DNA recombinase
LVVANLAAYLRVSTEAQAEQGLGLDIQREAVTGWAKSTGHKLSSILVEQGVSGAKELDQRPSLIEAFELLRQQRISGIVVMRLDRLARDLILQEQLLAEVRRLGGTTFSTSAGEQGFLEDDPSDPSRKLIRQVLGAVSEYERSMITLRLAAGRARKAQLGGYAYGAPPFGLRVEAGQLVQDESEADALRLIRTLHRDGASLRAIGDALEAAGHRPKRGGSWYPQTIARILHRDEASG